MKKILLQLILIGSVLLFISRSTFASHVIGYDLTLLNIKDSLGQPTYNYKIRLKFYRDVTGSSMPTAFNFNIRSNSPSQTLIANNVIVNKINTTTYLTYSEEECAPKAANLKVEYGLYESSIINMSNYNDSYGYYLHSVHATRNDGAINVDGLSYTYSLLMTIDFPALGTTSVYKFNNTPEFKKLPLTYFCVGKLGFMDLSAQDVDGDSLVYSLVQPLDRGNTKPFTPIPYAATYGLGINLMDGAPDISINSKTGHAYFIPTRIGRYFIAFKCEEYRNGVKIGEIRRELQIETILCGETAPIIMDENNRTNLIVDTIGINENYSLIIKTIDSQEDSIFMMLLPDIRIGENIFNPYTYKATWSSLGVDSNFYSIIEGKGLITGKFNWLTQCEFVREEPYRFAIVARDKTCPSPYYDSLFVELYVTKPSNSLPIFITPDTMYTSSSRTYYVNEGDLFQFSGDSILKTFDYDLTQTVNIELESDSNNGNLVNTQIVFNFFPSSLNSTAEFLWQTDCNSGRVEPYKFKFIAFDDDCLKKDTITYAVEIYVLQDIDTFSIIGEKNNIDTSLLYTYSTVQQANIDYDWKGQNVDVVSGQGTNNVVVKWKSNTGELHCVLKNTITNCKDSSKINIGGFVGVESGQSNSISIYPIPSSDILFLNGLEHSKLYYLSIIDLQGRVILSKEIINENMSLDISMLESGVYSLKLNNTYFRFIKE